MNDPKKELIEFKEEVESRMELIQVFCHDIRNALTTARLSQQLMEMKLKGKLPETNIQQKRQCRGTITTLDQIAKMLIAIAETADLSNQGCLHLNFQLFDLNDIINQVIENLSIRYRNRFVRNCSQEIEVFGNSEAIQRAIENACLNAVHHGAPNRPITISVKKNRQIELSIHNEGKYIPKKELEKLLNAKQRNHRFKTKGPNGWKLGLTAIKTIIGAHGGSIEMKSGISSGTTFTVILPKTSPTTVS